MLVSPFGPFFMSPAKRAAGGAGLLLHFNGTNGSTTFTDNSGNSRVPTVNGNAQISTAQQKFGTASGLFDGTGDSLQYAAGSQWSFSTGDWTIELWVYCTSTSGFAVFVGLGTGGTGDAGSFLVARSGTALQFYHEDNTQRISGGTLSINTWHAVSVSCVSGSVKMFLDGTQIGSTYTASTAIGTAASDLYVGARAAGSGFTGHLDELRVTKGTGYYTGTYTPETTEFPNG